MLAKKYGLKACFIAGTLVATAGGAQAIETLTPGDVVLAVDEHTNVVSERALLGVSSREVERYLDLRLEAESGTEAEHFGVTAEHPFWTSVGWKPAAELVPGDVVLSPHSGWLRVGGSTWVQGPARVWNLEVEEDHTFAVGGLGAWVHNGCGPTPGTPGPRSTPRDLREQLSLEEALAEPGERIMKGKIKDARYPETDWAKMQHVHEHGDGTQTVIHFWENLADGTRHGFKFK